MCGYGTIVPYRLIEKGLETDREERILEQRGLTDWRGLTDGLDDYRLINRLAGGLLNLLVFQWTGCLVDGQMTSLFKGSPNCPWLQS